MSESFVEGPCDNCFQARKLDNYLTRLKRKDYADYKGELRQWGWRIDAHYKQCPGHPWCEYPDELKIRRSY